MIELTVKRLAHPRMWRQPVRARAAATCKPAAHPWAASWGSPRAPRGLDQGWVGQNARIFEKGRKMAVLNALAR